MTSALVGAGVLFGLAHAAHCAGMCGVFALGAARGGRPLVGLVLYLLGKSLTYVFLGALAGRLGGALLSLGDDVPRVLALGVGALLVLAGLRRVVRPRGTPSAFGASVARVVGPVVRLFGGAPGWLGPFALGVGTGAIPCGVVYLAVLAALALPDAASGVLFMAAFSAGTAPVLLACGLLGRGALQRWSARPAWTRLAGVAVLATGLLTVARADASTPLVLALPDARAAPANAHVVPASLPMSPRSDTPADAHSAAPPAPPAPPAVCPLCPP